MIVIDEGAALRGLRHAVDLQGPGYRSPDRRYTTRNGVTGALVPCCIVGTALAHLGVSLSAMVACGNSQVIGIITLGLRHYGVEITPEAENILTEAQLVQDDHQGADSRWGAALRAAELLSAGNKGATT